MPSNVPNDWPVDGQAVGASTYRSIWADMESEINSHGFSSKGGSLGGVVPTIPQMAGAVGDGSANDADALKRTIEGAASLGGFATVDLGGRNYALTTPVEITGLKGVTIKNGSIRARPGFPVGRYLFELTDAEHVQFKHVVLSGAAGYNRANHVAGCVRFIGSYRHVGVHFSWLHGFSEDAAIRFDDGDGFGGFARHLLCQEYVHAESDFNNKAARDGEVISFRGKFSSVLDIISTECARCISWHSTSLSNINYRGHPYQVDANDTTGETGCGANIYAGAKAVLCIETYFDNSKLWCEIDGSESIVFWSWRANTPWTIYPKIVIQPMASNINLKNFVMIDIDSDEDRFGGGPVITVNSPGLAEGNWGSVFMGPGVTAKQSPDEWAQFRKSINVSGTSVAYDTSSVLFGRPQVVTATLESSTLADITRIQLSGNTITTYFSQSVSGKVHLDISSSFTPV